MNDQIVKRFLNISSMIGDTPLLEIHLKYRGEPMTVWAKAEYYNFTGSIKDRVAYHILKRAYETGQIEEGQPIAEATSGNTGIAFAALGSYLRNPVTIFMPDWMSTERISLIRSLGAEVVLVSKEEGGFTGSIERCERFAAEHSAFLPRQFANPVNVETHTLVTGPEIIRQLDRAGQRAGALVAGVGTGGTIMGLSRCFRSKWADCKAFPLDPENSPTMFSGGKIVGSHRIAGIGDEFVPPIMKLDQLNNIIMVDDGDAINMTRKLSSTLGLGVGISSGANFLGAIIAREILDDADAAVITTFADDNKKYLSTDLMCDQPVRDDHLTCDVELLDFKAYR
ncbi:MAG: PLP-dependent cysteine synthase family protein [Fastidiosipilaceae bacterium]|jgi:cysteine synthase A